MNVSWFGNETVWMYNFFEIIEKLLLILFSSIGKSVQIEISSDIFGHKIS